MATSDLCSRTILYIEPRVAVSYFVMAVVPATNNTLAREHYEKVENMEAGKVLARKWYYLMNPLGVEVTLQKRLGKVVYPVFTPNGDN